MQAHSVSLSSLLSSSPSPFPFSFSPISPSTASHYSPERFILKAGAEARSRHPDWHRVRPLRLQWRWSLFPAAISAVPSTLPKTLQCLYASLTTWPEGVQYLSLRQVTHHQGPSLYPSSSLTMFSCWFMVWILNICFFLMTTKVTQAHWKKRQTLKFIMWKMIHFNSIPRYIKLKSFRLIPLGFLHAYSTYLLSVSCSIVILVIIYTSGVILYILLYDIVRWTVFLFPNQWYCCCC